MVHTKRATFFLLGLLFTCFAFTGDLSAQPPSSETPQSWLKDVELRDAFFLDAKLGWVVGEHGTVLKTTDGGESWIPTANLQRVAARDLNLQGEMQQVLNTLQRNLGEQSAPNSRVVSTGINYRFESVHFSDARNGLVVGGYDVPYLNRSRAVVMRTLDGGSTWKVIQGLVIPRLAKVRMDNEFSAWAMGQASNLNGTGIYTTSDGGVNWSSQSDNSHGSMLDADRTGQSVVFIDDEGKLRVLRGAKSELSVIRGQAFQAPVQRVQMQSPKTGWAVGYSGQVLRTTDGGASWKPYSVGPLQSDSRFDFGAITIAHGKVWFAGNPGTYIFSVDLESGELTRHRTPITTAINSIVFPDAQRGWAVGDNGCILATTDGGMTWQTQRSGGSRVAMMAVSFDLPSISFAPLVQYAGENNLASAVVHVAIDEPKQSVAMTDRLQQATSRLGCNICRIIYPDQNETAESSLRQLTMAIRSLRPNAIVCQSPPVRNSDGVFDPHDLLERAIEAAADRYRFSDQLVELGLGTWQVDRLAVYDSTGSGELKMNTDRFLPSLGQTIEDSYAISASLMNLPIVQGEEKTYRVKQYSGGRTFRGTDLFDGLRQRGRPVPTRNESRVRRGNLQLMQQNVGRINQLKQLAQWRDLAPHSLLVWRQKLNSIIIGQDDDLAGVWLTQLANRYMQDGQWQMAAITLNQLTSRYQNHPLTPASLMWLAQYHASDEMLADRIRVQQGERIPEADDDLLEVFDVQPANFESQAQVIQSDGMTHMVWVPNKIKQEVDEELGRDGLATPKVDPATESYQQASSIVARIRSRDPDLAHDRHLRFLEAKLTGRVQSTLAAENLFQQLVRKSVPGDPVFVASGREIKLSKPTKEVIPGYRCAPVSRRPVLDGSMDDDCWSQLITKGHAQFLRMTPPIENAQPKTDVVVFAHDEEFLYIAARCNKLVDYPYQTSKSARSRDADLRNRDRIEFAVDTDRDYQTFLQFSVDHRGWCCDGANGSQGWDPEWYIAQAEDEQSWSIEVAIPLSQLTSSSIDESTVWGISSARKMGRYETNLWPTRNINFQSERIGLHRVTELASRHFELIRFGE